MCRWMGSHFYDWIDYNGAAFSIALLEWGRTFSGGVNDFEKRYPATQTTPPLRGQNLFTPAKRSYNLSIYYLL